MGEEAARKILFCNLMVLQNLLTEKMELITRHAAVLRRLYTTYERDEL